jgi:phage gp37-like protein
MARGRTLNRAELRRQAEAAEQRGPISSTPATETTAGEKKPASRSRRKKEPARLCARWGVFDSAMKQVAVFDYNQRALADQKAAELHAKKPGTSYFVQLVKEPIVVARDDD